MEVNLNPITGVPLDSMNMIDGWMANPIMLSVVVMIIILYYSLFMAAGSSQTPFNQSGSNSAQFFEILMWGVFLSLILLNGLRYFYGANITANLSKLFSPQPELEIDIAGVQDQSLGPVPAEEPDMSGAKQVFHIPKNVYTFDEAKAVCAAYDGELASYEQMKDAFDNGADWCGYGWSKDQMAFYPTQQAKYDELQKKPGQEHSCGRPGINGGYIANPNVRFGVNCYGNKPAITPAEKEIMDKQPLVPLTKKEIDFNESVKEWKKKIPNILLAPFNHDNWSAF